MKYKYTAKWLKNNGYHGLLCTEIPCGCNFDNLHQCYDFDNDNNDNDCVPAYKTECTHCDKECDSDDEDNYCMTTNRNSDYVRQLERAHGRWTEEDENNYQINNNNSGNAEK